MIIFHFYANISILRAKIQIKFESSKLLESFESFGSVEVGDEAGEFVTEGFDGVPLVVVVGGIVEALGDHLGVVMLQVVLVRVPILLLRGGWHSSDPGLSCSGSRWV